MSRDIRAIATQQLGDCILLRERDAIAGFALCHFGPGSEAGGGRFYVKFAAVRPNAPADFQRLLAQCDALAIKVGATRMTAGVNTGRSAVYRLMQAHGYRADLIGVAMHRPEGLGYNRPEIFAIDDWR